MRRGTTTWTVRVTLLALSLLVASATGCGSVTTSRAQPGQRPQTGGPSPGVDPSGSRTDLDPALGLLFGVPVYDGDFADPYVLADNGVFYAYATNTDDANLPVIVTRGGDSGEYVTNAFPSLPAWSTPGQVWAPAVYAHRGRYILYYTTAVTALGRQCVSRAVAPSPTGPFVDDSAGPMVCQADLGGTIDPSVVTDVDGDAWLLFKNDGNCCGQPTSLWSQQLTPDGLGVIGPQHRLLTADQPWEGDLIEAPAMVIDGDDYYLFYSANSWSSTEYAIGYAICTSITGPCTKPYATPWMTSTTFTKGPGGQEFYAAAGQLFLVYHGWERGEVGYPQGQRRLHLDSVRIIGERPVRVGAEQGSLLISVAAGFAVLVLGGAGIAVWTLTQRRRRRPSAR
jgi:hypothetical protein